MDKTRVKIVLASYREGTDDASDPVFREALDSLAQDSELAAWFRAEQAFDAAMVVKFREVPIDSPASELVRAALKAATHGDGAEPAKKE